MQQIKTYTGLFSIFLVWFLFAHPYFIFNKVPYPSKYQVTFFPPWSAYEKYWGPVKNNAMPDIIDQIYPWRHFSIEQWKNGTLPLWNPNSFAGTPHLANFQSAALSPFNIIFLLLPFVDAWSLLVVLQPLLAGLFLYGYLRQIQVSKEGSIIGSIAFMFCGFMVVWMAYGTLAMAILFLPLALLSIEKALETRQKKWFLLLASCFPLSFFSGHFQTSFYFAFYTGLYIFYKLITEKRKKPPLLLGIACFFGILLSLPQLLPSIDFYQYSVRSELFNTGGGIPLRYLITLVAPDFYGNPVTRNDWFGFYAEWSSFVGVVIVSLAAFAFSRKEKRVIFFVLATISLFLLAINTPIQWGIAALRIPVISTSSASRIIVLTSFSLSVLGAIGFDRVFKNGEKRNLLKNIPTILAIGGILVLVWSFLLFFDVFPSDKSQLAQKNMILPTILFACFSAITLLYSFLQKGQVKKVLPYMVILLVSFDSFRFAQKWMPFDPKGLVFPDVPVVQAMKEQVGFGRVFGNLGAHVDTYFDIPMIEGYDPLYIKRYGEFIKSAGAGRYLEPERSVVKLDRTAKHTDRVLDLLGVTVVFNPLPDTEQSWAYPVWKDKKRHTEIYRDDKFQLFRNNEAMDRVTIFYDYIILEKKSKIIQKFYSEDFDFRHTLILEEKPQVQILKGGKGSAKIVSYTPNKITIRVSSTIPGLLFLSDPDYPSWKASVNGKQVKIFRADYAFRAVLIPQGDSEVKFYL